MHSSNFFIALPYVTPTDLKVAAEAIHAITKALCRSTPPVIGIESQNYALSSNLLAEPQS